METKRGFTVIELLTVLVIIAILTSILMPTVKMVRNMAKETKVSAQLGAIGMGLAAFRNDYGDYPPSDSLADPAYTGAQMLCEALFGWDLMGFHPDSAWRQNGFDIDGLNLTYDPDRTRGDDTLYERKDRYLEIEQSNVYRLGDIFDNTGADLDPDTYVICDSFGVKNCTYPDTKKTFKIGTPILYYKANPSSKSIDNTYAYYERIYNAVDNFPLVDLGRLTSDGTAGDAHQTSDSTPIPFLSAPYNYFYEDYILDPKITYNNWPYRSDSYLLISAGVDGIYGTEDDITNFGN